MAGSPDVKCKNSKYGRDLLLMLLMLFFQLHLVTAAACDSCGCTMGKDFSDLSVQPGLSV